MPFIVEHEPDVLVCAANKADLPHGGAANGEYSAWQEWCLDNGMELLPCSALRDEVVGSRDAEGVERLIEAIGSQPWSSMVKKTVDKAKAANDKAAGAGAGVVDYSKWEKLGREEFPDEKEAATAGEAQELSAEKAEMKLDGEVAAWLEATKATDEEQEAVDEIVFAARQVGLRLADVFLDPSFLTASRPALGPNVTMHLNTSIVLKSVAKVLVVAEQTIREVQSTLRLGVRYALWGAMVAAGQVIPQPATLNPQPSTLNPQPSTINPQPSALDPGP